MAERVRVVFSGAVQGVGFRYTARDAARRVGVTGWVRNLSDGSVETMCEGERECLVRFLAAIRQGPMRDNIRDMATSWSEATGEFARFEIRPTAPAGPE